MADGHGPTSSLYAHPERSWARELAQPFVDDVVLAASLFKPNAAGGFEFSWSGFSQRQMLKARGTYLAERVILGVTAIEACALELALGHFIVRILGRWRRVDLVVHTVDAHGTAGPSGVPALSLADHNRELAELQALRADHETARVVDLLLSDPR